MKTDMKFSAPDPNAEGGALPFKIKSGKLESRNASGTIWVDADKGRVEKSEMNLELSGSLSIQISGQITDVILTQTQSMKVEISDRNPLEKKAPATDSLDKSEPPDTNSMIGACDGNLRFYRECWPVRHMRIWR